MGLEALSKSPTDAPESTGVFDGWQVREDVVEEFQRQHVHVSEWFLK
jgi:hypothetical protein